MSKSQKGKILIVEDEAFLSEMYQTKFKELGYEVLVGQDGKEAIELTKKEKPDLVLLDIIMPEVDGYEVLKTVRSDPETKDQLMVVLSNLGQEEEITKGMQLGADDYLVKSDLTPSQLVEKIEKVLAQGSSSKGDNIKTISVLLIDDSKDIIDVYVSRFKEEGFEYKVAENGAWGLKIAQTEPFDVILLDLMMPEINGLEALKTMRSTPKLSSTPIVVFSNSVEPDELQEIKQAGASEVYLKARVTPSQIVNRIRELVRS